MNDMNIRVELNVCRVCLQPSPSDNFESLFDDNNKKLQFQYSTSLDVDENDGLPKSLCPKCAQRLKIAYAFKKQSEQSDRHFRNFLLQISSQFLQSAPENPVYIDEEESTIQLIAEEDFEELQKDRLHEVVNVKNDLNQDIQIILKKDEALNIDHDQQLHDENLPGIEILQIEEEDEMEEAEEEEESVAESQELDEDSQNLNLLVEEKDDEEETDIIYVNMDRDLEIEDVNEFEIENNIVSHHMEIKNIPQSSLPTKTARSAAIAKEANEAIGNYCTKCGKSFSSKQNLIRHLQTHDGTRPFNCRICGRGFTQNGSLKQHMCIHTGERPFKCATCGRGFTQSKSLKFHMRRHTGEKPFTCDKCGLAFRQKDGLKRHILLKHSDQKSSETYICEICHKILQSKYSLQVHIKKHQSSNNTFDCEQCSRVFQTQIALVNHKRLHTGLKPFKCGTCGRNFQHKASLLLHAKEHMTSTTTSSSVVAAKYESTTDTEDSSSRSRKLKCTEENCDKTFDSKRLMMLHAKTHETKEFTEVMVDGCNFCQVPFVSAEDYNEHMLNCPDAVDAKCDYCEEEFTSRKVQEEHMETIHGLILVNE